MKNTILLIAASLISGLVGGLIASSPAVRPGHAATVVRAGRFELVDQTGRVLGNWVATGNRSTLTMYGRDQKPRFAIQADDLERPAIVMNDSKWEGRVVLGFIPTDYPSPEDDDWGLWFTAPGSERRLAGIGLNVINKVRSPVVIPDRNSTSGGQ